MLYEQRHEKRDFSISENKEAHQLCGNLEADQRLCFCFTERTIPLLSESKISKPLAIFSDCTAQFGRPGRKPRRPGFSQYNMHSQETL